ncbi:MAG: hypothetical protein KGH63_02400, partial [Candidatus Micrarchaeota archaeon]|nr:hypothetical protein [Candidatus Micrarchaeota archaeon]
MNITSMKQAVSRTAARVAMVAALLAGPKLFAQKLPQAEPQMPPNMNSISFVPNIHVKAPQQLNDTLHFTNPDTKLPGSLIINGQVVLNADSSATLLLSSMSYVQEYNVYYNDMSPKNTIALYGSVKDSNALKMVVSYDNKSHVLGLRAKDPNSAISKAYLRNGAIDSVQLNDLTQTSYGHQWASQITNVKLASDHFDLTLA